MNIIRKNTTKKSLFWPKYCEAKESINKNDTIYIVPIDLRFNHIEIRDIYE